MSDTQTNQELRIFDDREAVAQYAAERWIQLAEEAVEARGRFVVVLAGGTTPRRLYELLASDEYRERVPWSRTLFLFGDERCVPPDHEHSNYRMAHEAMLGPASILDRQVLRLEGERPPVEAAARYQLRVRDLYVGEVRPPFDLLLRGIGDDGHTASLFPETEALGEERRWVAANEVPKLDTWRLTLTLPALCAARQIAFLITGEAKASIVGQAFGADPHDPPYPCQRVVPIDGKREILLDRAAAANLP